MTYVECELYPNVTAYGFLHNFKMRPRIKEFLRRNEK